MAAAEITRGLLDGDGAAYAHVVPPWQEQLTAGGERTALPGHAQVGPVGGDDPVAERGGGAAQLLPRASVASAAQRGAEALHQAGEHCHPDMRCHLLVVVKMDRIRMDNGSAIFVFIFFPGCGYEYGCE